MSIRKKRRYFLPITVNEVAYLAVSDHCLQISETVECSHPEKYKNHKIYF